MTTFNDLAAEILADMQTRIDLSRLNEVDKRRLCAAYLRDDPSAIEFVYVPAARLPDLAALIEPVDDFVAIDVGDWTELLLAVRRYVYPHAYLERLVQGELDYLYGMRMAG